MDELEPRRVGSRRCVCACLQVEEADARARRSVGVGRWDSRPGEGRVPLVLPEEPEARVAGARQVRALHAPAHLARSTSPLSSSFRIQKPWERFLFPASCTHTEQSPGRVLVAARAAALPGCIAIDRRSAGPSSSRSCTSMKKMARCETPRIRCVKAELDI